MNTDTDKELNDILSQLATDGTSDTMWRSSEDAARILDAAIAAINNLRVRDRIDELTKAIPLNKWITGNDGQLALSINNRIAQLTKSLEDKS